MVKVVSAVGKFSRGYLAGLIDGEGCLRFNKVRGSLYPVLLITNTNLELLEELKTAFGGNIQPLSKRKENWKQGYYWRISWTRAVEFLSHVEPELRIKKRQAHVIFAWQAIRPGRGTHKKFDPDAADLLLRQMAYLNRKGKSEVEVEPAEQLLNEIFAGNAIALSKAGKSNKQKGK